MVLLPSFLLSQGLENQLLRPLAGDASGRQYYRLTTADGQPTGQGGGIGRLGWHDYWMQPHRTMRAPRH